jgi:hypothetical protein
MVLPQMVVNWPRSVESAGPAKLISLDYHKQKLIVDETLDIANMCYCIRILNTDVKNITCMMNESMPDSSNQTSTRGLLTWVCLSGTLP